MVLSIQKPDIQALASVEECATDSERVPLLSLGSEAPDEAPLDNDWLRPKNNCAQSLSNGLAKLRLRRRKHPNQLICTGCGQSLPRRIRIMSSVWILGVAPLALL